jgi:hypothetical protein
MVVKMKIERILLIVSSIGMIGVGVHTIIIDEFVFRGGHVVRGGEATFEGIIFIILGIFSLYMGLCDK